MSNIQEQYAENAKTGIEAFYRNLNNKDYEIAFGYLDPNFRQRLWQNDLAKFAKGYTFTKSMTNLKIEEISTDTHNLSYKDKIEVLIDPNAQKLNTIAVGNTDLFLENLHSFKNTLLGIDADPVKLSHIPLSKFLGNNAVELIVYLSGANYKKAGEIFERKEITTIANREAISVQTTNGWQIGALRHI